MRRSAELVRIFHELFFCSLYLGVSRYILIFIIPHFTAPRYLRERHRIQVIQHNP
jgi:hypothetical protein